MQPVIEAKLALGAAISASLLAMGAPSTSEISEIIKLGIAGLALFVVFRMATHTIPEIVKANQSLQLDIAKVNAEANKESSKITADAIAGMARELNEYANRMQDLLAQALKCQPPKA